MGALGIFTTQLNRGSPLEFPRRLLHLDNIAPATYIILIKNRKLWVPGTFPRHRPAESRCIGQSRRYFPAVFLFYGGKKKKKPTTQRPLPENSTPTREPHPPGYVCVLNVFSWTRLQRYARILQVQSTVSLPRRK